MARAHVLTTRRLGRSAVEVETSLALAHHPIPAALGPELGTEGLVPAAAPVPAPTSAPTEGR